MNKQEKTLLSFKENILTIRFREGATIEAEDVIHMYCYGFEQSRAKPFGILFDSSARHEFTEDAIVHLNESGYLHQVIAIAYISKDLISKIRLSLLLIFERPSVTPKIFSNEAEAHEWLKLQVAPALLSR